MRRSSNTPGRAGALRLQSRAQHFPFAASRRSQEHSCQKQIRKTPTSKRILKPAPGADRKNHVRNPREVCEPSLAPAGPSHPFPANLHSDLGHAALLATWAALSAGDYQVSRRFLSPASPPNYEFTLLEDCMLPCARCHGAGAELSPPAEGRREQHSCSRPLC